MDINKLFNEAKLGDSKAEHELFSILLVRFKLIAYHIIGEKDAAHDAANDAVMNVFKTYRKLEVHTSFISWAQTIVRRKALQFIGKRKMEQRYVSEMNQKINIDSQNERSPEFDLKLMKCLKKLVKVDKRYLRVLNLRHLGFTFDEICGKMNLKSNNAYVLLHRARKTLASCLKNGG